MMSDFEAYKMYVSVKNHFNSKKYSHIIYNGKTNLKSSSFQKRKDKIFFLKLAKHPDLENFLIANFSVNEKGWVKDLAYSEETETIYKNWLKRKHTLTYNFSQELSQLNSVFDRNFVVENNSHPILLQLYLGKNISLETFCILLEISGALKHWNNKLRDDPIWDSTQLLVEKYIPFIKYDKDKFRQITFDFFVDK